MSRITLQTPKIYIHGTIHWIISLVWLRQEVGLSALVLVFSLILCFSLPITILLLQLHTIEKLEDETRGNGGS